jgi:hypothetical protein
VMLVLVVEHYFPWQGVFRRKLHPIVNYVLGVLGIAAPLTVLFWMWGLEKAILALWVMICAGGLAVMGCYALDGWINARVRAEAAEREAEILKGGDDHGTRS